MIFAKFVKKVNIQKVMVVFVNTVIQDIQRIDYKVYYVINVILVNMRMVIIQYIVRIVQRAIILKQKVQVIVIFV